MELLLGIALTLFGVSVLVASFGAISSVVYPIVWWGVIFLIDAVNFKKWGSSLIHGNHRHAFLVLVPLSVIFWLYYEFVNLVYPQWIYEGIVSAINARVMLSILSFGTVIPIVMEIMWFLHGPIEKLLFTQSHIDFISRHRLSFVAFGTLFTVLPSFSNYFYLNQLMWIGPFITLLPFIVGENEKSEHPRVRKDFWVSAIATGLISGFLWEFLNYWAGGKWKYTILPDAPHIFEMPLQGYVGFIPFALSTMALYLFAKKFLPARLSVGVVLYFAAIFLSYLFVFLL